LSVRKPQIYPTGRSALAFAAGAIFFFAMPWIGRIGLWLGLAYNFLLVACCIIDFLLVADSEECDVYRTVDGTLSNGVWNLVRIKAKHRGERRVRITAKDEPPLEFETAPKTVSMELSPNEDVESGYRVRPSERGDYVFGDLHLRFTTKLGLIMRQVRVPSEAVVKVYPDIFQMKKHMLLAKENRTMLMGLRRSRIYGQGTEFDRLRDYVPDDQLRSIDWKATARTGSIISREYNVDQSQNIMILMDIGRTMASRTIEENGAIGMSKVDCAINASVLLAHVAAQADDRVGLFCFARDPVAFLPPGKGHAQTSRLIETLYPIQPRNEETRYYENFLFAGNKQKKRSMIFVITDMIDSEASRSLIRSIGVLARKHLVICIALSDYELPAIVEKEPSKPADVYVRAVALQTISERRKALAMLAAQNVVTIDASPSDLSVATVNKYLELKREIRL
jgi:uncharacterized protein (DUF58 family)